MTSLDLGVIGNGSYSALIDREGRIVWCCLPRFDGDPVFNVLVNNGDVREPETVLGVFEIALEGHVKSEQSYLGNTAVLVTDLHDEAGNAVRITDFAPRFHTRGRFFRPMTLVRRLQPLRGTPRLRIKLRPTFNYGAERASITHGSNHIRYVNSSVTLRLTTNAPISYVLSETPFLLEQPVDLILGPDETLEGSIWDTARDFEALTIEHWKTWVRRLALPLEWQDAVIRAAITLKLCTFAETGAIIAAFTTSIPEAPDTQRNWDYRYCWLRDAFFVIRALNSLAEVETMEDYLRYLYNIISVARDGFLQPVYGIGQEETLSERLVKDFSGYRGMGPVRVGNQAYEHVQHDVYGNVILGASQAFFDKRLLHQPGLAELERLEAVGEQAYRMHDQPDAGMWEYRTKSSVHTSSSLLCWAACDRLSKIAEHLELPDRAEMWAGRAAQIHETILTRAWNEEVGAFVQSFEGDELDASLLLIPEIGFLNPDHPKLVSTIEALERNLLNGMHMFRYAAPDDFGTPQTAFNLCTFWYIDALARLGRTDEARDIFEEMLARRNPLGLLSEDVDPETGELWGNFPQTYSLVGIINAAMRLSRKWEVVI